MFKKKNVLIKNSPIKYLFETLYMVPKYKAPLLVVKTKTVIEVVH